MTALNYETLTSSVEDSGPLAFDADNRKINRTFASNLEHEGSCFGLMEQKIKIDPEIQSLIPPLKPDELAKLRDSIQKEGCRDPLVIWKENSVLLDGHNRYAICQDLGKRFSVREMEFPDIDHALLWVLNNQLGRRNLSNTQFKLMIGQLYELEKKVRGGDRKSETFKENQFPQNEGIDSFGETAERLAKQYNISRSTVERSSDLHKALEVIRDADPDFAQRFEAEDIKVPKKDILALGKALQHSTPEQREQIVSELEKDHEKAIDLAREVTTQIKTENHFPKHEASLADCSGDTSTNPEVTPTDFNPDLDAFLELARRIYCPKCGEAARTALKWSCCGLSIDEAADLADDGKNEQNSPIEPKNDLDVVEMCEHNDCAETATKDHDHQETKCYSEMAQWIPPDNSSMLASKILRALLCILKRDEAPHLDTLTRITGLPEEDIEAYLEKALWVQKEESQDGLAIYLPRKPPQAT
jgi:hypothetical protein